MGSVGSYFPGSKKQLDVHRFSAVKVKTLHLHLDCRAGVLLSSSHMPQPSSSAWEGSATQVPPSCYVVPQGNQDKENKKHLGFFLAQGQHVASRYHTSHGTDVAGSEWTLHCSCTPVTLYGFRLLLMQLCYLKMNMLLVPACLAFLPAQFKHVLQELDFVQLKQLLQQLNQKSPLVRPDPCPVSAQSVHTHLPGGSLLCQAHRHSIPLSPYTPA